LPFPDTGFAIATGPLATAEPPPPPAAPPQAVARRPQARDAPPATQAAPVTRMAPLVVTANTPGDPRLPAYPPEARYRGHEGDVLVEIELDAAGSVLTARVKRSSGHASLDGAAIRSARALRFRPPRAPPGVVLRNVILVEVPFSYRLQ
jgi:protein TonB